MQQNTDATVITLTANAAVVLFLVIAIISFMLGWAASVTMITDVTALNAKLAVCEKANSTATMFNAHKVVCHNGATFFDFGDKN